MNKWLSNNKTIYVYPLTTPTKETIELPTILTNEGTNVIEVNPNY